MRNDDFYALTFFATCDTIQTEKKIKEKHFAASIIPTPREISASCGFAIRFGGNDVGEEETLMVLQQELSVDSNLYHLGQKEKDGKRSLTLLASHRV